MDYMMADSKEYHGLGDREYLYTGDKENYFTGNEPNHSDLYHKKRAIRE
jgi:hypothetical protein